MRRALTALFIAVAGPAIAACPDYYRFVDFGIVVGDGTLVRGGPLFRAEDFDDTPLLSTEATVCTDVLDLSKDGRGNPIPVVTKIAYDRRATDPALGWIEVAVSNNADETSRRHAAGHTDRLANGGVSQIKGDAYLCAIESAASLSCQIVSPYPNTAPAVVYCAEGTCRTGGIAMNARLVLSASWPMEEQSPDLQAANIVARVRGIADFLAPISSSL